MTNAELDSYGKITHAVALFVSAAQITDERPNSNELNLPPPYYTHFSSLTENSIGLLWDLKIMKSLGRDNEWHTYWKFNCELADVPTIAMKNASDGPPLERLVWLYVELRSEYTQMHAHQTILFFREGRAAFSARKEEEPACRALVDLGYATTVPLGFASTPKTETLLSTMLW